MIQRLKDQGNTLESITAENMKRDIQTGQASVSNLSNAGGLADILEICIGAKVMLTVNIDVLDGLVNGARGSIVGIAKEADIVKTVLVQYDNPRVERKAAKESQYRDIHPSAVPIQRHEMVIGKVQAAPGRARSQFPLQLAWALTIHKVQGLTVKEIVKSMGGRLSAGQAYVALSRVKSLEELHILQFKQEKIPCHEEVMKEMDRMQAHAKSVTSEKPTILTLPSSGHLKIVHLNVRSYKAHHLDIALEPVMKAADIVCLTETYLKSSERLSHEDVFQKNHTIFRKERSAYCEDLTRGGIMVCVQPHICVSEQKNVKIDQLEYMLVNFNLQKIEMSLITLYRRPVMPVNEFINALQKLLQNLPNTHPIIVTGDFSEDLLTRNSQHCSIAQFLEGQKFTQLVNKATTDQGSLLDHVYVRQAGKHLSTQIDVIDIYFSDHDAVCLTVAM